MSNGKHRHKQDENIVEELNKRKDDLVEEIEQYNRERDQIKTMLSRLGGQKYSRSDVIFNIIFVVALISFFALEIVTQILPTYISLEIGILLVSIKIIWMIHSQHKFNHFLFWILNSIEFRMNNVDKRVKNVESRITALTGDEEEPEKTASQHVRENLKSGSGKSGDNST